MNEPSPLQWLPAHGRVEQLMILLHGVGSEGRALAPLARRLRAEFPQSAVLAPDGFEPFDMAPAGRQWFSVRAVDEANRVARVAAVLPRLAEQAPAETTLHLFHGAEDEVIPAEQARLALERLAALQGDATIDIAEDVGHELAPVLVERALFRLRNHIPYRTWAAAMGTVPGLARRADEDD